MLRSLGSSLVAKLSHGASLRDLREKVINRAKISGRGALGSISRKGIEEPIKREVPAGSTKVVANKPVVENQALDRTNIIPSTNPIPASKPISEISHLNSRNVIPSGNNRQALFQGGVSTPNRQVPIRNIASIQNPRQNVSPSISPTRQVSRATIPFLGYKAPQPTITPTPQRSSAHIQRPQNVGQRPAKTTGWLSGRVFAGGMNSIPLTKAQHIVGKVGKVINRVAPRSRLGHQLQSWGGITIQRPRGYHPNVRTPRPSFKSGLVNKLRSVQQKVSNSLRSAKRKARNWWSRLRSRWGR